MAAELAFIPEARTLITRSATAPTQGVRRRLTVDIEIRADGVAIPNQGRIPLQTEVLGAGDVIALDRSMIARVEPAPSLRGFEPNFMPFVEFVDADLPWRYTLDGSTTTRVRPWLALIALEPLEFEFVDQGRAPLPRIRVFEPQGSLPDLSQSWAFAHVQVRRPEGTATPYEELVRTQPAAAFSRLLCPRQLRDGAAYYLFLVPTFEAGRLAGLGDRATPSPWDAPAWEADSSPRELPIYFQSRFVTNALEDFEMLVRRLRPARVGAAGTIGVPARAFSGEPGYYAGYRAPGQSFEVQSALRRAGHHPEGYNTEPDLASRLATTLSTVIVGETVSPEDDGPEFEDPLVAMPPYGWRFRQEHTVDVARAQQGRWFHRLNLDLKFRHAAGRGAETVRRNQELFARICWHQYEEIVAANHQLARLGVAQLVGLRLTERLSRLPNDVQLVLAEPLHPFVPAADGASVGQTLRDNGVPQSYTSRALRRVAARRPVTGADPEEAAKVLPTLVLPGDRSPNPLLPRRAGGGARRMRHTRPRPPAGTLREFTVVLGSESVFDLLGPPAVAVPVAPYRSDELAGRLSAMLEQLPLRKARFMIQGLTQEEQEVPAPIYRSPRIPVPLSRHLLKFAPQTILRGVDELPDNSVAVVEENRAFVEAFLVGANDAMNEELRWREFPTDMRGTIFARFWDRGRSAADPRGDDVPPIHEWTRSVGRNFPSHDANGDASLVFLVRGDVIRKLADSIVVLNRAEQTTWRKGKGIDYEPMFTGRIGPDIGYYGFDVPKDDVLARPEHFFFVLFEAPGRLRFGLDVATVEARRRALDTGSLRLEFPVLALGRPAKAPQPLLPRTRSTVPANPASWDDLSWLHVTVAPSGYVDFSRPITIAGQPDFWGPDRTSATLARSFLQKPVAAVIPATRVLL